MDAISNASMPAVMQATNLPQLRLAQAAALLEPASPAISTRSVRKQAWLALHFVDWPLHAALQSLSVQRRAELLQQPVVVLDADRQRRVLAANVTAVSKGVRPGHALNAALALCAELTLLPRDVRAETHLLNQLAQWAQRYTPVVSVIPPNELLLEVRGSLRLFGGVTAFLQKVQQGLQIQSLNTSMALTATARASLWLARTSFNAAPVVVTPKHLKRSLSVLPLRCLHWPGELQWRLARFGIQHVGELWRLPRADLARRIGAAYLKQLDAALGRQVELQPVFKPLRTYAQQVPLEFEIQTTVLLEPVLNTCLQNLQDYLRRHDLALGRIHIELLHRDQPCTPLQVGLATPSGDMQRVAALLHEQLVHLQLPAPVREINLRVKRLLAAQGTSQDLLTQQQQSGVLSLEEGLACLLERLQVRLGPAAIQVLHCHADHRPEQAQRLSTATYRIITDSAVPVCTPPRPLWLLPQPVQLHQGKRPPQELRLLQGPERIEAGWWDERPIKRDYYLARRNHSWCWVFKDLLSPGWYLQGWFA